jgi:hypothetical protein
MKILIEWKYPVYPDSILNYKLYEHIRTNIKDVRTLNYNLPSVRHTYSIRKATIAAARRSRSIDDTDTWNKIQQVLFSVVWQTLQY